MKRIEIKPCDFEMRFAECPPGLFLFGEIMGLKTEYGKNDVFLIDSGEVFWGGVSKPEDRDELIVIPLAPSYEERER